MFRPLEGVRVLDLSRVLAGPYAAKLLQDLGADVLRVEAPWGDDTRGWGPPFTQVDGEEVAAYWTSVNLGKQVVRRDLRREEDLEDVRNLVAKADVILENFRPGRADAWFAPWPERAVVCSITAYGNDGPRRDEGGYDLAMQARSGLMGITGDAEGGPAKVGVAVIDVATGLHAGAAVLAALFRREREGVGSRLTLSLWDCALDLLINQAQNALVGGTNPGRMGTAHPNLVPYRAFQAADGEVAIAVGSDPQWAKLVTALDLTLPDGAEWTTNPGRVNDRDRVEACVANAVAHLSRAEVEARLVGVPCAPVNRILEAMNDAQAMATGARIETDGVPHVASPHRFHT